MNRIQRTLASAAPKFVLIAVGVTSIIGISTPAPAGPNPTMVCEFVQVTGPAITFDGLPAVLVTPVYHWFLVYFDGHKVDTGKACQGPPVQQI